MEAPQSQPRRDYLISREPRGQVYRSLLEVACDYCDRFLFALPNMEFSSETTTLLARLEPFLLECEETGEYPALVLLDGTVTVCHYRLDEASLDVLTSTTDQLYNWVQPDLPNDLCLLKGDRDWLTTMASCREAVLTLAHDEFVRLSDAIPDLRLKPIRASRGQQKPA